MQLRRLGCWNGADPPLVLTVASSYFLDDGSWLVLEEPSESEVGSPAHTDGAFLGVTSFIAEAAAAGVLGNITFAVLGRVAAKIGLTGGEVVDAAIVADRVSKFLEANGFTDVVVTQIGEVAAGGWLIEGVTASEPFTARSEISGRVMHVAVQR